MSIKSSNSNNNNSSTKIRIQRTLGSDIIIVNKPRKPKLPINPTARAHYKKRRAVISFDSLLEIENDQCKSTIESINNSAAAAAVSISNVSKRSKSTIVSDSQLTDSIPYSIIHSIQVQVIDQAEAQFKAAQAQQQEQQQEQEQSQSAVTGVDNVFRDSVNGDKLLLAPLLESGSVEQLESTIIESDNTQSIMVSNNHQFSTIISQSLSDPNPSLIPIDYSLSLVTDNNQYLFTDNSLSNFNSICIICLQPITNLNNNNIHSDCIDSNSNSSVSAGAAAVVSAINTITDSELGIDMDSIESSSTAVLPPILESIDNISNSSVAGSDSPYSHSSDLLGEDIDTESVSVSESESNSNSFTSDNNSFIDYSIMKEDLLNEDQYSTDSQLIDYFIPFQ